MQVGGWTGRVTAVGGRISVEVETTGTGWGRGGVICWGVGQCGRRDECKDGGGGGVGDVVYEDCGVGRMK